MGAKRSSAAAGTASREIVLTRVFDAPREVVFMAWTVPEYVGQWWGPRGFTTTTHEIAVRPGGVWRFIMHGPDGVDYPNKIAFIEVVPPERLVYTQGGDDETGAGQFRTTVTFAKQGAQTLLTMQALFESAEERDRVVKEHGAIEGGQQHLERCAEHVARMLAAGNVGQELVLTRVFNAPRALVFKAWTDPNHLAQWFGPRGFTNTVCEADARAGGKIRIHMRAPDGAVYPVTGEFQQVVEPERLVFTSSAVDAQGRELAQVLNTVTFTDQGGQTTLTLRAKVVKTTEVSRMMFAGQQAGWTQSLEKLAELLDRA